MGVSFHAANAATCCEAGCPACTGPRLEPDVDGKALALRLLAGLTTGPPDGARTPAPPVPVA